MTDDWLDDELTNWGRWCNSGPWPHPFPPDHAASAEGRYLAPIIEAEDAEQPRPIRPNAERAEIVHRVYREQLTERERRVLVLRYVRRVPANQLPRAMRTSQTIVTAAMLAACRRVGEAFRETHALRA